MGRILYQPYKYIIYIPVLGIMTALHSVLAILVILMSNPGKGGLLGISWARIMFALIPAKLVVKGKENIDPSQSYVIVSNHISLLDIFVLYGWLGMDFRWFMKAELRKVPFLGIACQHLGHIFIDRANKETARLSLEEARSQLVDGTSVLFFAEGTRSKGKKMLPFKKGAFVLAKDMNLPVLPVTIVNTNHLLPRDTLDLLPGKAELIIHPPITVDKVESLSTVELVEKCKETIASAL